VRQMIRLAVPRTIGAAGYHINLIVMTALASTIGAGSIAIFNFANHIQYIPIGLIGISFAVASFPALSRAAAQGNEKALGEAFSSAFRHVVFLVLPIAVLLFLLRNQIVGIVYQTGVFEESDAQLTAAAIGVFAAGVVFHSLVPLITRVFFAVQNTKTPAIIGIGTIALNIVLALFLLERMEQALLALPLAFVVSVALQCIFLLLFLRKLVSWMKLAEAAGKMLGAGAGMGLITYVFLEWIDPQTVWGIFLQAGFAGMAGLSAYMILAVVLRIAEAESAMKVVRKIYAR
jgi:putative peptidoglycan lipid II flippase